MRLACAATLLMLLVCTAPAQAAFPPPSITSFEIIHEGNAPAPDEGNTVVRVGYDFPGNPPCRRIFWGLDGHGFTGDPPPGPSTGTFEINLGVFCDYPVGEHTVAATPASGGFLCLPAEELVFGGTVQQNFTVTNPGTPSAEITLDPAGNANARVTASFPFTCHDCNERGIDIYVDGTRVAGGVFLPFAGTQDYSFQPGCLPPGNHTVKVVASRCYQRFPPYPAPGERAESTTSFATPAEQGTVTIANRRDPVTKKIHIFGSSTLPPNTSNATLVFRQSPTFAENGDLINATPLTVVPAPQPGQPFDFEYTPPNGARQMGVEVRLELCNGQARAITKVQCDECQSADPVFFNDGNMRYTDTDPLPRQIDSVALTRTYDTYHELRGSFGRGSWSLFDARLAIDADPSGDTIVLTTMTNESAAFLRRNGVYTQMWPRGHTALGTLARGDAESLYVYRPEGSRVALLYFVSDGRLAGLRQIGTGREMRVQWSAAGLPESVTDSWSSLTWSIATDAVKRRITSITIGDLVWQYQYDTNDNLAAVLAPGGATWRTYEYLDNRMTAARDAAANLIESHSYSAEGAATNSTGPADEIESIQYNVAGASGHDTITRATMKTGAIVDYLLTPAGGAYRTARVVGGCAACGTRDAVFAYDEDGHLVRDQNASGYITARTYAAGRLTSTQRALKPSGCDPETSPSHCLLDPATLATTGLEPTTATLTTTYEYADPNWPDRVTATMTPSITTTGQLRREEFQYHPLSGEVALHTMRGWMTGERPRGDESGTMLIRADHSTLTTFYGDDPGSDEPDLDEPPTLAPVFDPGGTFESAWLNLAQPILLRKTIDGPRTDAEDITYFVYYPIHESVPATLRGHLAATKNALGHITRFESYDIFGNVTRVVDPNGVATQMTYDSLGRLTATTTKGIAGCDTTADPLCASDLTMTRTYSSAGPLDHDQRAGGGVTSYEYDGRGRVATMSRGPSLSALSERIESAYDPGTGKPSLEKRLAFEGGAWVEKNRESFAYDTLGQLQTVTHPDLASVGYTYDQQGRMAGVRDENHAAPNTTYTYDPAGRIATVKQTLEGVSGSVITTAYAYDVHANLTSVTDPNGNVTHHSYDDFGRMVSQQSPVTGAMTYEYDEAGNLTRSTDANGALTTRVYDALNRVTTATSARGTATETVTWTYDDATAGRFGIGRAASMSDPAGTTSYSYERRGLLRSEQRLFAGTTEAYTTAFTYDADGNRASLVYPSGLSVTYVHDFAGRPTSATTPGTTFVSSAQYLPFGPMSDIVYGNGTHQAMQYDARYRMIENKLTGPTGTLAEHDYSYDDAGNITGIADALDDSYSRTFDYDDLNRLTTANTGAALWGSGGFTYDKMGNMLSSKIGDPTTNVLAEEAYFTYAGTTPKVATVRRTAAEDTGEPVGDGGDIRFIAEQSVGYQTVSYDDAGNELTYVATRSYSPRNVLESVTDYAETFEDIHRLEYQYDGRGIRVVRAETQGDGTKPTRYFTYSPELQLLSMTRDDQVNVWGSRIATHSVPTAKHDFVWFGGRSLVQVSSDFPDGPHWYFNDHLGTPLMQTNASGTVVWHAEYQPYGDIWTLRVPANSEEPVVTPEQPLRFPGQEVAMKWEGTEERYNIARWYRAGWGRYTQADPAGLQGNANPYSYALSNPLKFLDPLGLVTVRWTHYPDETLTRTQFRNRFFPSGAGGQYAKAATLASRDVDCQCRGSFPCVRMHVTITVGYKFVFTTDDEGDSNWPPIWRQQVEEGIHLWQLQESTLELSRLAEEHERERYFTRAGCELDCWRLQNHSWLTRWLPGLTEQLPGLNPHRDDY